ncbi:MAG: bifunctional 5,10-methylene-tetrahydrofolate dehydrogenase/5,10-methylene-tetrahydrofolate cyclohydrolase, partial [Geopsychrobacter sp.]|nr:bifunctional 5,10-methylene-tetrahydrofolate dehydrogenase/5,10-methylene-tetrahydrofolate cyclohydrolase [Geopsychrobacter sp.]
MAEIIDGRAIAAKMRKEIKSETATLTTQGVTPGLAVVLVGEDPASRVYVSMKEKACTECGIFSAEYNLSAETSETQLLELIEQLNADARIDGILVQLPLPGHIKESKVLESISPDKDVDGFHPYNVGRLVSGNPLFRPCTPYGVMKMLAETGVDLCGNHVAVFGRSNIVGK